MITKFWPILIPVFVGLAAYGYTRWDAGSAPNAVVEATTDLGTHDNNKLVTTKVRIHNAGRIDLVLSQFSVSCASCLTFSVPGAVDNVVTLASGEAITVDARIIVHGVPEKPFAVGLYCKSNDPRQPELHVTFTARVRGRLIAVPPSLDVGTLKPGEVVTRQIEIRDISLDEPFQLGRMETLPHVRVYPTSRTPSDGTSSGEFGKHVITLAIEVTGPLAGPTEVGLVRGDLLIYQHERGDAAITIPIRGEVPARITVTPPAVVLPRASSAGADYTAECKVTSTIAGHGPIALVKVPPELTVSPISQPDDGHYRIEWRADQRPPVGELRSVGIRFRVGTDEFDVPVRCLIPGAP